MFDFFLSYETGMLQVILAFITSNSKREMLKTIEQ
jgi:hypothetical protein